MPRDIGEEQLRKLSKVVSRRSDLPFYQELYQGVDTDINAFSDFRDLPFTSKDKLMEQGEQPPFFFGELGDEPVGVQTTGGTTGIPAITYRSEGDFDVWDRFHSKQFDTVITEDARTLVLMIPQLAPVIYRHLQENGRFAAMGDMRDLAFSRDLAMYVEADTLWTTPSFALKLGKLLDKADADLSRFTGLVLGAETLSSVSREQLEELYPNAEISQVFGSIEFWGTGYQCPDLFGSNQYHYFPDHHLIEILDPETLEPVEEGETGELVVTTLWEDTGIPLNRFRTGDAAALKGAPCDCGASEMVIDISGRLEFDTLKFGGITIYRENFEEALKSVSAFTTGRYQIHVYHERENGEVKNRLKVDLVPRMDFSNPEKVVDDIETRLMEHFDISAEQTWKDAVDAGTFLPIKVELVDDIQSKGLKEQKVVDHRSE